MPNDPVNTPNMARVIELLVDLDRRMREGFAALTQGQDDLRKDQETMRKEQGTIRKEQEAIRKDQEAMRKDQEAMRKDQEAMRKEQQTLGKRMEEGFADAAQERQALGRRIDDGLATEAVERQILAHKLDELRNWLLKEIPENANMLFDQILADRQKFEGFREEMLKFKSDSEKFQNETLVFQNFVKENLKYILNVLEKHEQHLLSLDELVALLHQEFVEFKKDRFIHEREVQQRLSRLEAAA